MKSRELVEQTDKRNSESEGIKKRIDTSKQNKRRNYGLTPRIDNTSMRLLGKTKEVR
jgi:hypothetical protein